MKRMLLVVLAINLSACNMLDGISGSSSSTGSSVTEDTSTSTDEGSDILMAEESDAESAEEETSDAETTDEVATDEEADEVADQEATEEVAEETESEVVVDECSATEFFNGQLEICGERVSYLFTDANGGDQNVLLSEFQVLDQSFHVVTSFYSGRGGSFLNFPADHQMPTPITIGIPSTIAASGRPGNGHELVIQINSDIHCIYTSYANRGYRSPVCYQGSSLLDDGTVQVVGAIQVPASIFTDVNYVRAHIRMANGSQVLTTASIDIQVISE